MFEVGLAAVGVVGGCIGSGAAVCVALGAQQEPVGPGTHEGVEDVHNARRTGAGSASGRGPCATEPTGAAQARGRDAPRREGRAAAAWPGRETLQLLAAC